jgi:phosphoglycolate phosphatase
MPACALVLDLDGTLVDTAPDLAQATNHVLSLHDRRAVSLDEVRSLVGHGARTLIRRGFALTGPHVAEDWSNRCSTQFIDYYGAHISQRSRPFPGVIALLDRCREAGIKLAVCTNKPESLSLKLLGELDLSDYFSAVVGADTVGVAKPDPAPYFEAVRRAGATVPASLMVGDSGTDVLLARAVGRAGDRRQLRLLRPAGGRVRARSSGRPLRRDLAAGASILGPTAFAERRIHGQ